MFRIMSTRNDEVEKVKCGDRRRNELDPANVHDYDTANAQNPTPIFVLNHSVNRTLC